MKIPLSKPDITESEIDAVTSVLRTPQLSLGPKLLEFEAEFARYTGSKHAVALSSGTAGLHLALLALGIQEDDEVIMPSFTFLAVANAVVYLRAKPVFTDIDPLTLNVTAATVERVITAKTRAIVLVHTFGHPAEVEPILELARQHHLRVIEDACEAVGAERGGRKCGSFGDVGVFSFYPNKPITTGEGGLVVTDDAEVAGKIRALRNQGRSAGDGWLQHSVLGYNYRIADINCALGIAQLKRIEMTLASRENVARLYSRALEGIPGVSQPPMEAFGGRISWFAYVVRLPGGLRDHVSAVLSRRGIESRAYFPAIHLQPLYAKYRNHQHDLGVTEDAASRTLALPFFNQLGEEEVAAVCGGLSAALENVEEAAGEARGADLAGAVIHSEEIGDR